MVISHAAAQPPKTHNARPLADSSNFVSAVSIIVPFHGQYELCTELVQSILRLTRTNFYELCIVDDSSPNENYIQHVEANLNRRKGNGSVITKCIRCTEQLGFGGAAKVGFDNTENPYVVVINSDCVIEDLNWLRAMGESLLELKEQGVRMVSPKTNNPVGGSPKQLGNKQHRGEDLILSDDEHLSMFCFMCHRELFARIGGFIRPYPFGFYEDEELAYRMRRHGFKQGVSGKSWVYHKGEATVKYLMRKRPEVRTIMEDENYQRCLRDIQKNDP